MTGVDSYSTTPLENETVDGTVTWKEGQLPSTVNNGERQMLTDLRERFNDLPWFQYGHGTQDTSTHLAKPCVYVSGTSFSVTGGLNSGDHTAYYHAGRPVRAVGTLTGTIYGYISSSSYNAGLTKTTVVVAWLSGSLTNEALVISAGLPALPGQSGTAANIYDMFVYFPGVLTDGEVYPRPIMVRNVRLPASLTGSQFAIGVFPTATLALTIKKNSTTLGTISFSTLGVATATFAAAIDFAAGDILSLTGPSTADVTGANISVTFLFMVLP